MHKQVVRWVSYIIVVTFFSAFFGIAKTYAASYTFPVIGSSSFSNGYNSPRAGGPHYAIDIFANKWQPIVSATDGTIEYVTYPEPSWGYAAIIKSTGDYCYWYLHINNDRRGTDNGRGGAMAAFAPDIHKGNPIKKGQLIGWVGDSGNAESTPPHLHFSVHRLTRSTCATNGEHDNPPVNPYTSLVQAKRISKPVQYPALPNEILPFGASYRGGINIAIGDIDNDEAEDILVGAGSGGGPKVNIYRKDKTLLTSFYTFDSNLRTGGVDVAAGNVSGDENPEIVTTTRLEGSLQVAIHQYSMGQITKLSSFDVLVGQQSTPRVTTVDIDNDGVEEIIVGAGAEGGWPKVEVYKSTGELLQTFVAYDTNFTGGVDVAAGNVSGDENPEIIVGPLTKGSSKVRILSNELIPLKDFFAYKTDYRGGVKLSVGNVIFGSQNEEIMTLPNGATPTLRTYSGEGNLLRDRHFMEQWWRGYYDVAAGENYESKAIGINRRGSVR